MMTDQQRTTTLNVAQRLVDRAREMPDALAIAEPLGYRGGRRQYRRMTFRELDQDSDRIARGLRSIGAGPGTRLALMVRQSANFIALVFGLYKAGATIILIDPGMGIRQMLGCLAAVEPEGFVAIPPVHAVRLLMRRRFPKATRNVTVGRRWFWGGATLEQFRAGPHQGPEMAETRPDDPAAIIFTSGSTGPAKGVWYTHRNFDTQVEQIQARYAIRPGEIDVPGFPLFGLFNAAMGVTSVLPDMDPTRPAQVDPKKYIEAIDDFRATQSFASPALWNQVSLYCAAHDVRLDSIRRIVTAGAPVPSHVLQRMRRHLHDEAELHTPYGATESLPVASISAREILGETAQRTAEGGGVCVGNRFSKIEWKIIGITDDPIERLEDVEELPRGQIGEIVVTGPVVTQKYVTRVEANRAAKMVDAGGRIWHRMGDVGYLDDQDRFWMCGRKGHRVQTARGTMFTVPCEAVFNRHEAVFRSALVGVGAPGEQTPVVVVELQKDANCATPAAREKLARELRELARSNPRTESIDTFLVHRSLPVDVRHNAKIFREKLAVWAARELGER